MGPITAIPTTAASAPRAAGQTSIAPERSSGGASAQLPAVANIPVSIERRVVAGRPEAGFLAHLIATRAQMPQTRALRRADSDVAAAIYADASRPIGSIGTLCRRKV